MDFGDKIRVLRQQKGMTLQELGDKVGVGASTVRKWEIGYIKSLRTDKINKLAKALDTTPTYLLGSTDQSINIDNINSNNGVIGSNSGEITINNAAAVLSKEEQELLKIFESLDVKKRIQLLTMAYDLASDQHE